LDEVRCPLCGSTEVEEVLIKTDTIIRDNQIDARIYVIYMCKKCGVLFCKTQ